MASGKNREAGTILFLVASVSREELNSLVSPLSYALVTGRENRKKTVIELICQYLLGN